MNGPTLRTYRKLLGFDATQLAARLSVNRRTVTRWEHADQVPDDVAQLIRADLDGLNAIADDIVADHNGNDHAYITISQWTPTGDHIINNAAAGVAAAQLEQRGTAVTITYDRREDNE